MWSRGQEWQTGGDGEHTDSRVQKEVTGGWENLPKNKKRGGQNKQGGVKS